jgi:hypothetical protein
MLLRMLSDGQWHERERILATLARKVAPGKALRRYRVRATQRAEREGPRQTPELSMEEQIASGQRTLANVAMNSLKKKYIDVGHNDVGEPALRVRPGVVLPDLGPPLPLSAVDFESELDGLDIDTDSDEETYEDDDEDVFAPVPAAKPAQAPGQAVKQPAEVAAVVDVGCPLCGLFIANKEQHEEFHRTAGGPPTTTDLLEAAVPELVLLVRATVAEAVTQVVNQAVDTKLDGFQEGMSKFLDRWFNEVLAQQAQMVAEVRRPRPGPPLTSLKYTSQDQRPDHRQNRPPKNRG